MSKKYVYRRYLKLKEYAINESRMIVTDKTYPYRDKIKGTEREDRTFEFYVDENGFIKPSGIHEYADLRIGFIGDSVTESALCQPSNRWTYQVAVMMEEICMQNNTLKMGGGDSRFYVDTYNAGQSGMNCYDAMNILVNKMLPMKVDIVVFQCCIHDIMTLVKHGRYIPCFFNYYGKKKEIFNRIFNQAEKINIEDSTYILTEDKLLTQYRAWIISLIEVSRTHGLLPVFLTQATRYRNGLEDQRIKHFSECDLQHMDNKISYEEFKNLLIILNDEIRKIGQEHSCTVIDLENEMNKEIYFYDHIHYSDLGHAKAANLVSEGLYQLLMKEN